MRVSCAEQQFSERPWIGAADLQPYYYVFRQDTWAFSAWVLAARSLFSLAGSDVTKSPLRQTCDFRSLNNANACTLVLPLFTLSQQGEMQLQLMKWSRGNFEWGESDWLTEYWLASFCDWSARLNQNIEVIKLITVAAAVFSLPRQLRKDCPARQTWLCSSSIIYSFNIWSFAFKNLG